MIKPVNFSSEYKSFRKILKAKAAELHNELGSKVDINPTSKKLCRKNGIKTETANIVNTADYLKAVYKLIKSKGYKLPGVCIDESIIPRESRLGGIQQGNWNIFGPGKLDIYTPSIIIHEEGHFLHTKNMWYNQGLYAMFNSFRSIFRPFLNKKEKEIFLKDIKRAYNEGYFSDMQLDKCLKKGYISKEILDEFNKKPETFLSKNAFTSVDEFIAEYFALAAQGFKFSQEITKRYKFFHGPDIKNIITKSEINNLISLRKELERRV